jgi:Glycolipid transfer protein (GLTP)
MDFLVELFKNLLEHPDWTMPQTCTDSYEKTLKKWHGWLASSSFKVWVSVLRSFLFQQFNLNCKNIHHTQIHTCAVCLYQLSTNRKSGLILVPQIN